MILTLQPVVKCHDLPNSRKELDMIKNSNSKCLIIVPIAASLLLCACGMGRGGAEGQEVADLINDTAIVDRYFEAVQDCDHAIYEQTYYDWGGRSIGPTEYGYRGIIYLTDEEAARLWDEYEWEEVPAPEFEFIAVDGESVGDGPWYSSSQFDQDNDQTVIVQYTVFDGEKLVFSIHQT